MIAGQSALARPPARPPARLDPDTGRPRWVDAGHPEPRLLRDGRLIRPPSCRMHPPLGLQLGKPATCAVQLMPGDRVLFWTDGIVEAARPAGSSSASGGRPTSSSEPLAPDHPAAETLRRLMHRVPTRQADRLQEDTATVLVEWRTGKERQPEP